MYCVRSSSTAEETIRKSRFISHMVPVSEPGDINSVLRQLQQLEYWLKKRKATIESRSYTESIELVISLPADDADELKRLVAKHDT